MTVLFSEVLLSAPAINPAGVATIFATSNLVFLYGNAPRRCKCVSARNSVASGQVQLRSWDPGIDNPLFGASNSERSALLEMAEVWDKLADQQEHATDLRKKE